MKNNNGNYVLNMLRGGGMMLSLKMHMHTAGSVFAIIGKNIDAENVTSSIDHLGPIMIGKEKRIFDKLSLCDRLMIILSVMNATGMIKSPVGQMSPEAQALSNMVITRFNKMTAGLKEAFCKRVKSVFDFKNINLYNKNYDSISIELKIVQNRKTAMERYSFYNDNDTWRLYLVETK